MAKSSNEFYVYALLDPRSPGSYIFKRWKFSFEPFYIGKGKRKRAYQHTSTSSLESVKYSYKAKRIRSIQREGLQPIVLIKRRCLTELEALELERRLIQVIGRRNLSTGPLANLTDGGQKGSNRKISRKLRESRGLALSRLLQSLTPKEKLKRNLIRKHTSETKRKIGKSNRQFHSTKSKAQQKKWSEIAQTRSNNYWASLSPKKHKAYRLLRSKLATEQHEKRRRLES